MDIKTKCMYAAITVIGLCVLVSLVTYLGDTEPLSPLKFERGQLVQHKLDKSIGIVISSLQYRKRKAYNVRFNLNTDPIICEEAELINAEWRKEDDRSNN